MNEQAVLMNVDARGIGESIPKAAGVKNGVADPKHRRVYIELDGRAVGSLRVLEKEEE